MKKIVVIFLMVVAEILVACNTTKPIPNPLTELTLTATDIAYDVNQFEVPAGQPVKITLRNNGAIEHDFSIMEIPHTGEVMSEEAKDSMSGHDMSNMDMEPEIHVATPMGESFSVEFTPSTPGTYEFFCTVAGHKEAGMTGTLVVTAP